MRKIVLYLLACCVLFLSVGCNEVEDASSTSTGTTTASVSTTQPISVGLLAPSYPLVRLDTATEFRNFLSALEREDDSYKNCAVESYGELEEKDEFRQLCKYLLPLSLPTIYSYLDVEEGDEPKNVFLNFSENRIVYTGDTNCLTVVGDSLFGSSLSIACYPKDPFPTEPPYPFIESISRVPSSEEEFWALKPLGGLSHTFTLNGHKGEIYYTSGSTAGRGNYIVRMITENAWVEMSFRNVDPGFINTLRKILDGTHPYLTLSFLTLGEMLDTLI